MQTTAKASPLLCKAQQNIALSETLGLVSFFFVDYII
jgi:hypothetical protein